MGLGFLALYWATLAPDVVGHDAGEMQYVPYIFGIPHLTGYPLQLIAGKLWSFLPVGSVAYRMNLLSAVCGAAAASLTYLCALELTGSWAGGLTAALATGLAPLEWTWSTIAGVRSPAVLFVAAVLLAALRWERAVRADDPKLARRRLIVLGLVAGLALDHHRTIVFLFPLLGIYLLLVRWPEWPALGRAAAAGLAPLALYGILPLRAALGSPWDQWNTATWGGFTFLVLGTSEASAHLTLTQDAVLSRLPLLGHDVLFALSPVALALAVLGLIQLARQRPAMALVLAGYTLILGFFTLEWYIGDSLNLVYLLPAYVPLGLLAGVGVAWLSAGRWPVQALLVLGVAGAGLYVSRAHLQPPPEVLDDFRQELFQGHQGRRLADAFGVLPPNATVVANWDQATVLWYAQFVDHLNPTAGIVYPAEKLQQAVASARGPVFLATATQRPATANLTADGPFVQLLPEPATEVPPSALPIGGEFGGEIELAGIAPPAEPRFGVLPITLYWRALRQPAADYHVSVRLSAPDGAVVAQRDEAAPVLGLSPTSHWTPGQVTADYYELDVRPLKDGTYNLEVILYETPVGGSFRNLPFAGADHAIAGQVALSAGRLSFSRT